MKHIVGLHIRELSRQVQPFNNPTYYDPEPMESFKHISVTDAKQMVDTVTPVLIDIRDAASYQQGRMAGARHLDNDGIAGFIQEHEFEEPVIVCCYHGNMSQQAAQFLIEQGFDDVYSLDGGYAEWAQTYPSDIETG